MFKWLLFIITLMMTGIGIVHSQPLKNQKNDIQFDVAYCLNSNSNMDIDNAEKCDFISQKDLLRAKPSDSINWLRVQINQSDSNNRELSLFVGPHFLSDIRLYEKISGEWRIQIGGSRHPFNSRLATLGGYIFQIKATDNAETTSYLKIQKAGVGLILIDVAETNPQGLNSISQFFGIGLHIGALTLILAFSIFSYVMQPSVVMFRFCWLMFDLLLCILAGSGIMARYVFDQQPWLDSLFFNWVVCLRLACWVWVSQAFLRSYRVPYWYTASCWLIYTIVIISLVLVMTENMTWVQPALLLGFMLTSLSQIIAIRNTPGIQSALRTLLLAGFIGTTVLICLAFVLAIYPFKTTFTAVYVIRLIDFVTPMVLLAIIALRNRLMHKEFEEIKSENIEVNLRLDFERKLLKDRRVLIDMLTHELKNPLASISLAIGSLKQSLLMQHASEQRRLHNVSQSVLSMDSVIERCHLMNQIDSEELSPRHELVNVSELILGLTDQLNHQNKFHFNLNPDVEIITDRDFLRIILINLLENALKYSPEESEINVSLSLNVLENGKYACITVSNLTKEDRAPDSLKIFERYYRDQHDLNTSGSGLGLYLVKELCKILKGSISFEYEMKRARFHVALPMTMRK